MLFDTGSRGFGVVEVDSVYTNEYGTKVGLKAGEFGPSRYMLFPSGNCCLVTTAGVVDPSPEAWERTKEKVRAICCRA